MYRQLIIQSWFAVLFVCLLPMAHAGAQPEPKRETAPSVVLPLDRTAYFIGEKVPVAVAGMKAGAPISLEAADETPAKAGTTNAANTNRVQLYRGPAVPLVLDTAKLSPGRYRLHLNGTPCATRLTLVSVLRRSAGSMQDECTPREPQFHPQKSYTPEERAQIIEKQWDAVTQTLEESGLTASVAMAQSDMGRAAYLDPLARVGALLLVNADTRPTSFFPVGNLPEELDGMSQRMILTAQANGRYPNFGGFCFGWDTTGYATGGRRGLMTYWGWGDKTQALRNYIDRLDRHTEAEFTRRTGLAPAKEAEYIAYLLSLGRPEFAPAIDLPTKLWLEEIARHTRPLADADRAAFEKRLDAWSAYLMGLYREGYGVQAANLRSVDPALRNTASVQVDHTAVRFGQYFPSAYVPLDLQYQSTWNDQVGGPDYAYQWLLTAGLLEMHRNGRPTWISNTFGTVHARSSLPGKFVRLAAHGLGWGVSGIGFAHEGFSNLLGGMNADSSWERIRNQAGGMDVRAGRDFLDRFAALAVEGRPDHGVGILVSKSQYARQHIVMGFGTAPYKALVALTRLGYTPCYVTEEDMIVGRTQGIEALLVIGQTVPLPLEAAQAIGNFVRSGKRVLVDGSTTVALAGAEELRSPLAPLGRGAGGEGVLTFPFTIPGKPHSWTAPNMAAGENDALLYARWHRELAPALLASLADTGRGALASDKGAEAKASLIQIDGGRDARYIVAVNDSHIQTQADWHQVKERLLPTKKAEPASAVYDCTEERPLGKLGLIECDLLATTARVFAVLPRALKRIDLSATQSLAAGDSLLVRVRFLDDGGKELAAVLPFHLAVLRPGGQVHQEFYRSTNREGQFTMALPLGTNVTAGEWSVAVRSQLNGEVAKLPVTVRPAQPPPFASALSGRVVVRQTAPIKQALARGSRPVLPIFDSPAASRLLPVAEKVRAVLAAQGVEVEIRRNPAITTYWLAYDPTEAQKQENAHADRGESIGKIRRETVNANDWYSALSGYRFGRPVVLLDLAGERGDNPLAEALDGASQPGSTGILWPQVSAAFPGPGRAVVQGVHWAFAPRVPAVVIQAMDVEGLMVGAESLARLPDDFLTPGIEAAKTELWRQYHVGGRPSSPAAGNLTSTGLKLSSQPRPFAIQFVGERPLPAEQAHASVLPPRPAMAVPAVFGPKQFVPMMRDGEKFIEAGTAEMLLPDLRFSEGIVLVADVKQAGKTKVTTKGLFRYSDRKPCWQAQWEDIVELREKMVPKVRRPMEFEVQIGAKTLGKLVPAKTETREVPLELASPTAGLKPRTAVEEVVTQLTGDIDLPAGRHEILLIHRNVVDGKLEAVGVGQGF